MAHFFLKKLPMFKSTFFHLLLQKSSMTIDKGRITMNDISLSFFNFGFLIRHRRTPFKQTAQYLQLINVKKCPSGILCWDSNSQHLAHESSPIITKPWHLPYDNL